MSARRHDEPESPLRLLLLVGVVCPLAFGGVALGILAFLYLAGGP